MELFTATGKLKKFFWQLEMFDVCTTGDTAHIDTIFKLLPHTRVNMGASIFFTALLLQWSVPWGQRGRMVLSVGGSFAYFARNARCTVTTDLLVWYSNTQNDFSSGSGHFLTTYTLIAQRQKCELRWKATYWEKNWVCSFCLYRFRKYVSYDFPITNFCNPGVHYETPCIIQLTLLAALLNVWIMQHCRLDVFAHSSMFCPFLYNWYLSSHTKLIVPQQVPQS